MTSKQPQIGERYRNVGNGFPNAVWILSELFTTQSGIEHAHLTSASNATECKTLALSVVADPKRYVLAENQTPV
jgi:hypothetical protein